MTDKKVYLVPFSIDSNSFAHILGSSSEEAQDIAHEVIKKKLEKVFLPFPYSIYIGSINEGDSIDRGDIPEEEIDNSNGWEEKKDIEQNEFKNYIKDMIIELEDAISFMDIFKPYELVDEEELDENGETDRVTRKEELLKRFRDFIRNNMSMEI
ncbi:hypothetical protein P4K23_28425 [Bacillus cereus]|uniref:hypothetical protein n=1 Tax=Bacillus toyonensis TaxID=155322 RepID=UPI000BFBC018|nr:hypothetical protein [Bacillus toyonensis]MEB9856575.1 hypothetical protein [Bacillus cereus]MEB9891929.1 hypothetical protein [Bacillus cereus]PHA80418.1 hypothetical protein COE77_30990 [Bacillus toyonensis]